MPKKKKVEEKKLLTRKQIIAQKAKASAKKFRQEIKKSMNTAIVAAFGFLIALAWRDVISEWVKKITEISPIQGKLIEALIITIIAVTGILIVTKIFSNSEDKK